MTILFEQDNVSVEAEPLSNGESIEEFYSYRMDGHPHSHTSTDIERSNVSELFFYRDPDGSLSLVIIHDDRYDDGGGDVTFEFTGLPDDGSWAVRDDDPGNDTYFGDNKVEWHWGPSHTDGGAYRADFDDFTNLTIDPSFYNGIDQWQVLSGDAENPTRTELDMSKSVTISLGNGGGDTLSTSATTVTLLPGHSEDSQGGGDDLDSAMPDYWGKSLDAWFIADQVTDLPDDLEEVEAMRRHLPEYDEGLKQYRLKNHIEIEFSTADDRTIADWSSVRVRTNDDEEPPYVAVEGQPSEDNAIRDIIEDDELDWFDGKTKLRADIENKRFESGPVKEVIDGVEGVRTSVIFGGSDTYITIMKEKYHELGPIEFSDKADLDFSVPAFIIRPPTMYTFLELVLMSDGTKLARVWDSSRYPKHYLYVDETKQTETEFEEGSLLNGGEWEQNQNMNPRFTQWVLEEQDVRTPFYPHTHNGYERFFDAFTAYGPHPVMTFGESGEELTKLRVEEELDPLFPW